MVFFSVKFPAENSILCMFENFAGNWLFVWHARGFLNIGIKKFQEVVVFDPWLFLLL